MKFENIKNNQGFTLIEILISMAIFSLLIFAVSIIYVAFNNSQIYTTTSQQLLNDSQYAIELMTREIRKSSIVEYNQNSTWCNDVIAPVLATWIFDDCIVMEREDGQVFAFTTYQSSPSSSIKDLWYVSLDNCGDDYMSCDNWKNDYYASTKLLSVNLNNISVESLDFFITPDTDPFVDGGPNQQPKVTILMTAAFYNGTNNPMKDIKHTFQTTVSSRVYRR